MATESERTENYPIEKGKLEGNSGNEEELEAYNDDIFEAYSGDSEYDTDLDYVPVKDTYFEGIEFTNDEFIGRRRYLSACSKCENSPPQKRFLKEMESSTVSLSKRSMGHALAKPLCIGLVDNLRVENLLLDGADIGDLGGHYISQLLLDNMVITRLNISGNNLSLDGAKYLSVALAANRTLQHLNLSDNRFGDDSAIYLSRGISKNKALLSLNLSKNNFAEESGTILGGAIADNTRLIEFDSAWNQIRQKGAVGIFKGLTLNKTLKSLKLSWNGLGYEGSVAILKALKDNTVLIELDISNNRINWNGAVNIAKGLRKNRTLQVLKVGNNPLTTTGAMDIVLAVSEPPSTIRVLDMMNVSVLGETELLAVTIERQRKFKFIHGGVVRTPDKLGERKEREITSMQRVMEYMKKLGIRPVELLRAFDKNVMFNVTQNEFIKRLKKSGIPLHNFEMEALAKSIAERDVRERAISYNALVDAVNAQILKDRMYKIKKRNERIKLMKYHKQIMSVPIATDTGSDSDDIDVKSVRSVSQTSQYTSTSTVKKKEYKLPPIVVAEIEKPPTKRMPTKNLSLCAPLDKSEQKKKKKVKRRRKKKKIPEVTSWMSAEVA